MQLLNLEEEESLDILSEIQDAKSDIVTETPSGGIVAETAPFSSHRRVDDGGSGTKTLSQLFNFKLVALRPSIFNAPVYPTDQTALEPRPYPIRDGLDCFWMLRLLLRCLVCGGQLTESLYVPLDIWHLNTSLTLKHVPEKTAMFSLVAREVTLLKLEDHWKDAKALKKDLLNLYDKLYNVQKDMSTRCPEVGQPPVKKHSAPSLGRLMKKLAIRSNDLLGLSNYKLDDPESYRMAAVEALQIATTLEVHWKMLDEKSELATGIADWRDTACIMTDIILSLEQLLVSVVLHDLSLLFDGFQREQKSHMTAMYA